MGQTKKLTLLRACVGILTSAVFFSALSARAEDTNNFLNSGKTSTAPESSPAPPPPTFNYKNPEEAIDQNNLAPEYYRLPDVALSLDQHLSYELNLGLGRPGNKSLSGWSWNAAISAHYFFTDDFDLSLFYRHSKAKGVDNVEFDTSFSEERIYSIGIKMMGAGARMRILGKHAFEIRSGISFTSSVLSEISTTAPVDPTLTVGDAKAIPRGTPLDLIYSYEWRGPKTGAAATLSFTQSSLGKNESTAEISVGVALRYYSVPWELRALEPEIKSPAPTPKISFLD